MKYLYLKLTALLFLFSYFSYAQKSPQFQRNYEPVRSELKNWDPVRGDWLANSIPSVIVQEPVRDRTFPENLTPQQVLALVPKPILKRIQSSISVHKSDPVDGIFWTSMENMISNVDCVPVRGRSYGDPHLKSYDGERFSFQTVGEFVLTKSANGAVEVQSRQKPINNDFSLNTAVAANVNGDRVCLYAEDHPDGISSTPLRVNGRAINIGSKPFFLANGGVVTRSNRSYIIDWPTGESMTAQPGRSSGVSFYNISMSINPCTNSYSGVLGNANGVRRDDFNAPGASAPITFFPSGRGVGRDIEKQRLAFLAKDFADHHRVRQATSLFDYAIGQSTFTFTDRSFPRVHRSIHDLNDDQRALARRRCQDRGISQANMAGCIYDNAYLNIEPIPEPPVRTPIKKTDIQPVRTPVTNTNPEPPVQDPTPHPIRGTVGPKKTDTKTGVVKDAHNEVKNNGMGIKGNTSLPRPTRPAPSTRPSTPRPKPVFTPPPTIKRPAPRPSTPRSQPVFKPRQPVNRPTPRPTPRPRPSAPKTNSKSSGRG